MHGGILYKFFFLSTLSSAFNSLANNDNSCRRIEQVFGQDLVSGRDIYKAEDEYYFIGGGIGITTAGQHKMEISDSKPTAKPSSTKVRIVSIEGVEFCTAFVGGVHRSKTCGLMKGDNGYCNKYKTHADIEKGHVESAFYLTTNVKNLFLKPMVSLIIGDANHGFLSQVGEEMSKDNDMAIMEEVKRTMNTSTEEVEEDAYFRTTPRAGTEVID